MECPKLSGKAFVDGVLYRPMLDAVVAYYSRPDVLHEMHTAMLRWHVRLEPGEGRKHQWFNVSDADRLHRTLMRLMDRMRRNAKLVLFPYLRLDPRRYRPVLSWDPNDLWGWDFMIEKDAETWRPCWDAMVPVIRILEHFGVHYWLKYSGHNSLHVLIPAESFPLRWGKVRLAPYMTSLGWRLKAYFSRACFQAMDESGYGGGASGTNMPYSLNEHSGLLNYPVRKSEIATFQPEQASVAKAKVRSFWRDIPAESRGSAEPLIAEALKPCGDERDRGMPESSPLSLSVLLKLMRSRKGKDRRMAVVRLPWFTDPEATEAVLRALNDRSVDVRKATVKALVAVDHARCESALTEARGRSAGQLASWIDRVQSYKADIAALWKSR